MSVRSAKIEGHDGRFDIIMAPGARTPLIWDNLDHRYRKITRTGREGQKKYGMVTLERKKYYVARLVAKAFLPYEAHTEDLSVRYKDKDTENYAIDNLYWDVKYQGAPDRSLYKWIHDESGEIFIGRQNEAVKKFGTFCSAITRQKKGQLIRTRGWRFLGYANTKV